jgi:hypothetical protein
VVDCKRLIGRDIRQRYAGEPSLRPPNLHLPLRLDIGEEEDWANLHDAVSDGKDSLGQVQGIVMSTSGPSLSLSGSRSFPTLSLG